MALKLYVWSNPWGGKFGPLKVSVQAKDEVEAEFLAVRALRKSYQGYNLRRVNKIGPPDGVFKTPTAVVFDVEGDIDEIETKP